MGYWMNRAEQLRETDESYPLRQNEECGGSAEDIEYEKKTEESASPQTPSPRLVAIPASPLRFGWLVMYRDQRGALCGGCDDRQHGTVQECRWAVGAWTVHLTDGQRLPLSRIQSVGKTDSEGKLVAAWSVRAHGYDGEKAKISPSMVGEAIPTEGGLRVTIGSISRSFEGNIPTQ